MRIKLLIKFYRLIAYLSIMRIKGDLIMKNEIIEKLKKEIVSNYRPERYQRDTGDLSFRFVPSKLQSLWYGDKPYSICYRNMDYYCRKSRQGEMEADELIRQLLILRSAFAHEYELIYKANF